MLNFPDHFVPKLSKNHNFGDNAGLAMHLKMFHNAFRTKQYDASQTHISPGCEMQLLEYRLSLLPEEGRQERKLPREQDVACRAVYFVQKLSLQLQLIGTMGSQPSNPHQRFHSRYNFVQTVNDVNFGLAKVYRKKEMNFDYVMVFERRYSPSQLPQVKNQLQQIRSRYSLQEEQLFLKIISVEQLTGTTCGADVLRIYLQYLNFTLKDAIYARKELGQPFTSEEIMYVMQTAIAAHFFLKSLNANYLTVRPDSIYINTDGVLRFNPTRVQKVQTEQASCQCLDSSNQVHFQKSERQFLIEIKSTLLDLVEICPQNDQNFKRNYELLARVNHSRTLQQVLTHLWVPEVDTLLPSKRLQTTDLSSGGREGIFGQSIAKSKISLRQSGSRYG